MTQPLHTDLPPRTESQIVTREIQLTFGDKEYRVPVLRKRQAAKWREEYFKRTAEIAVGAIVDEAGSPAELKKKISQGIMGCLLQFPDKIPELVYSYAPSLPKEEIEEIAYDQEFSRAFAQIWQVAFEPFLASLGMVLEMQRAQASNSRLSASLN